MNKTFKFRILAAIGMVCGTAQVILLCAHQPASASAPPVAPVLDPAADRTTALQPLPGGASSLNEMFQDWKVVCRQAATGPVCLVIQQALDSKTKHSVMSVQLRREGSGLTGAAVLPFGISLAQGASIVVDGKPLVGPLPFSTCVSAGCVVPLKLDSNEVAVLEAAQKIEVKFSSLDGRPIAIPVSNNGLQKAADRIGQILR